MLDIETLRRLPGTQVVGADGERVGKVVDVYGSATRGGTFATVSTGLFGTGASFFPLAGAELRGGELVVPHSKDTIKHAPRVEHDEDLTPEEEVRLFAHYGLTAAGPAAPDADPATMTLSEERLRVGTERVVTGRARLRKYVVAETVTQTVPLLHEELRVVREPIAPGDPVTVAAAGAPLSEEEHEVVLFAERPVVEMEVVPVERVRLDTLTVAGEETVTGEVRKEHVELEETDRSPAP